MYSQPYTCMSSFILFNITHSTYQKLLHVVIIKVFVLYFVRLFYKIFGYIKEHFEQIPCEIIMFCDLSKMVILRSGFVRRRAWSKAKLAPLYIFSFGHFMLNAVCLLLINVLKPKQKGSTIWMSMYMTLRTLILYPSVTSKRRLLFYILIISFYKQLYVLKRMYLYSRKQEAADRGSGEQSCASK